MSKKTTKAQAVDARLFQQIQPHGGITFADPSYTRMGDGYCRCLHIYGLPNTLDRHWLTRIFTVSGCICSFDVATEDMAAVKRSINRSIGEEGARAYDAKDYNALYDAQKRQAELQQLYDELERMGEVMKICDFRIFLQAQMLAELEEKTKELQDNLDASGYKNTVLLGEQKTEWQSLYEPFAVTHAKPVTMKGLSLTARQLAEGYTFRFRCGDSHYRYKIYRDLGDLLVVRVSGVSSRFAQVAMTVKAGSASRSIYMDDRTMAHVERLEERSDAAYRIHAVEGKAAGHRLALQQLEQQTEEKNADLRLAYEKLEALQASKADKTPQQQEEIDANLRTMAEKQGRLQNELEDMMLRKQALQAQLEQEEQLLARMQEGGDGA